MSTVAQLKEVLGTSDFESIEELAAQNYGPRDIAKFLNYNLRAFMHIWRDKKSRLREAYDRGMLEIEIKKTQQLVEKAERGDLTAIQIHDKKADAQRFEDIKQEVFSFE